MPDGEMRWKKAIEKVLKECPERTDGMTAREILDVAREKGYRRKQSNRNRVHQDADALVSDGKVRKTRKGGVDYFKWVGGNDESAQVPPSHNNQVVGDSVSTTTQEQEEQNRNNNVAMPTQHMDSTSERRIRNLTLQDGFITGRVMYKFPSSMKIRVIPRQYYEQCSDDEWARKNGIYFLAGRITLSENITKRTIYVGQANIREDGTGIYNRIGEKRNFLTKWDGRDWERAIVMTEIVDQDEMTQEVLNYIERAMFDAFDRNKNWVKQNKPKRGRPGQDVISELNDQIKKAKPMICALLGQDLFID